MPPALLGVSAWAPLRSRPGALELSRLDDDAMVDAIRDLAILPDVISVDPDMLKVVLPTLRADLSIYADYRDVDVAVRCPIAAYGAASDPLPLPGALEAWTTPSHRFLGISEFPGGHFSLEEHAVAVAADLTRHLHRELTVGIRR